MTFGGKRKGGDLCESNQKSSSIIPYGDLCFFGVGFVWRRYTAEW